MPTAAYAAFWFHSVKRIEAADRYTVVVTLTHPDATWPYTPAAETTPVFEMKFAQAHKGTLGKPGVLVMGSGPWEIGSLDPTKGVTLSANPHWWGGKVPIQRITYTSYSSETSLALAFRAGQVDFDPYIHDARNFATASGAKIISATSQAEGLFSMNTHAPGWDDVHVRRAVAYTLDRTDIIAANGGDGTPIYTFVPPPQLQPIASQSQIGINAQVKAVTSNAYGAIEAGPAAQRLATFTAVSTATPDPSGFNYLLGSQNTQPGLDNYADYASADLDRVLAASTTTLNPAQRFTLFSQLLRRLATDVPYVPLYSAGNSAALSAQFTDPGYDEWFNNSPYALDIRPAA